MTRKNYRTSAYRTGVLILVTSLALMVSLSACVEGPVGIFASITQETDLNANRTKAFDGASADFVGLLDDNYYTIINGTIWSRPATGGSWERLATMPAGVSNGTASSATITGNKLFVVFGLIGDSNQKVWHSLNGATWVDSGFTTTEKIDSLLSVNGETFAVTRTDTTVDKVIATKYSVYYWDGSNFLTAGTEATDIGGRPTSAAYDGTNYWITAGTTVYSGPRDDLAVLLETPTDTFAGAAKDPDGNIILSSMTGKLYKFNAGWTSSAVFKKSDKPHAFSAPVIVADGANEYLLVGTIPAKDAAAASGYLEFDITDGFDPTNNDPDKDGSGFADIVNFQTSISTNYIRAFTVADESAGKLRVFALTMGNGLWSNYYNGTSWAGWARE